MEPSGEGMGGGNNSLGVGEDIQALDEGRRAGSECPREAHCVREEAHSSAHASRRTKQPPIPQHHSEISKKGAQHLAQGMASCVGKQSGAVGATSRPAAPPSIAACPRERGRGVGTPLVRPSGCCHPSFGFVSPLCSAPVVCAWMLSYHLSC